VPALRRLGARGVTMIAPGRDGVPVLTPRRGRSNAALRVLCVANWSRAKGVDVLVAAVSRVRSITLTLAGDGTRQHGRGSRVRGLGAVGPARLARLYAEADVL